MCRKAKRKSQKMPGLMCRKAKRKSQKTRCAGRLRGSHIRLDVQEG